MANPQIPLTTYRHALRGALGEFRDKTPFKGLLDEADLVEVAACVAYHVEEGVRLYPEVIFCSSIDEVARRAPNSHFIQIGNDSDISSGIKKALKKLSPLTSRDWLILIEITKGNVRVGIFNPSPSPVSLDFGSALEAEAEFAPPVIRVSRPCEDIVRFYAPIAGDILISFSHKEITAKDLAPNAALLAEEILGGAESNAASASAKTFLKRSLDYALQQCHGALICVLSDQAIPAYLSNGILLQPPIDFTKLTAQFLANDENNEVKGRPFVHFDLVAGIIAFDGVVVFSRAGHLLAYNCILDLSVEKQPQKNLGGSRRAAFSMLKQQVGSRATGGPTSQRGMSHGVGPEWR